jgi:hypothetical protein
LVWQAWPKAMTTWNSSQEPRRFMWSARLDLLDSQAFATLGASGIDDRTATACFHPH